MMVGRPSSDVPAGRRKLIVVSPAGTSLEGLPLPDVTTIGGEHVSHVANPTQALHDLTGWALQRGVELSDLSVSRPSLEDVYLELAFREDEA